MKMKMKMNFTKVAAPVTLAAILMAGCQPLAPIEKIPAVKAAPQVTASVYEIRPNYGNDPYLVHSRDALGVEIAQLAKKNNEQVFFHREVHEAPGGPEIFLECTPAFLAQVKTLPDFGRVSGTMEAGATQRSDSITHYFESGKISPAKIAPASQP